MDSKWVTFVTLMFGFPSRLERTGAAGEDRNEGAGADGFCFRAFPGETAAGDGLRALVRGTPCRELGCLAVGLAIYFGATQIMFNQNKREVTAPLSCSYAVFP
jgi:hypothetical protein